MLEELRIRGLGVIDDATLELDPGLNVVTGETGAGKTMVVTGLGLLMGDRADAALVRGGADRVMVEGRFALGADHRVQAARVEELGGALDSGALLVGRALSANGRSRAFAGGAAVPATVLAELTAALVEVHGQGDQHRLLSRVRQRAALDRYAGMDVLEPLVAYQVAYDRLTDVEQRVTDISGRRRERAQEAAMLRYGVGEIERVAPEPGEDLALAADAERLEHAEGLRVAAEVAHAALVGDESGGFEPADAATFLAQARKTLDAARHHDPTLGDWADRLAEAAYLVDDLATELASYRDRTESDPLRLAAVQERRAALITLVRRYADSAHSVDAVLAWADRAERRLLELEDDDGTLLALSAERASLRAELAVLAAAISSARQGAALRFSDAVSAELADLAMPDARVRAEVTQRADPDGLTMEGQTVGFGPSGVDEVELLLQPHPGSPARPIAKAASGGELSRVMLAIEVVFAGADPVATFVFDEVDAGVGGRAAVEVGRRLARLSRSAQVVVVTHLPQVAAFADRHWLVEKNDAGAVSRSDVNVLDRQARVDELARMLAGLADSDLGRAHADELLDVAQADRT
ncbi:MAG: DNA repair protein RecN [Candidatus Nanopelagicales bacterium]